jgi:hypothetical protein
MKNEEFKISSVKYARSVRRSELKNLIEELEENPIMKLNIKYYIVVMITCLLSNL